MILEYSMQPDLILKQATLLMIHFVMRTYPCSLDNQFSFYHYPGWVARNASGTATLPLMLHQ